MSIFRNVKNRNRLGNSSDSQNNERNFDIPNNLFFKCPRCQTVMIMDNFIQNKKVCLVCNYHSRLSARERIELTVDADSFVEYDATMQSKNPINFPDYENKILALKEKTNLNDAVLTGECTIKGSACVIGVMDSHFMMASMGSVVGEKITRAFEQATKKKLPIILFTSSGGARMQEGIISLMQMAKTSGAASIHSEKRLLYVTVLTDPTTGGVTASFASLGDIILAEPKVLVGFAGRRVIESTIRQHLPDDFQSSEFLLEHGFIDAIVDRIKMRQALARILKLHAKEAYNCEK